jgi:hypothetical protein
VSEYKLNYDTASSSAVCQLVRERAMIPIRNAGAGKPEVDDNQGLCELRF